MRFLLLSYAISLTLFSAAGAGAQAPANPAPPGGAPDQAPPLGVTPLPQGPPPTGLQAPLPSPAERLPAPDRPLTASPDLAAIDGYVRKNAITLQDAVAIALYTSREFAAAAAQLQQAQGRTGQARAALNPTLGVNANLTEFDAPTTANFGALAGAGGSGGSGRPQPPFVITPQFNPVVTTAISLPIDIAGTIRAAVSQAQFAEVAARIDVNRVRNQIVFNVKNAFYGVLRAQAQVAVANDTLQTALTRLSDATKNFAAGVSPRFDVITAQRDVADAQQGVINARAQRSVSLAALKNAIGLSLTSPLRVAEAGAVEYPPGVAPPELPAIAPSPALGQPAAVAPAPNAPPIQTPLPQPAPPINTGPAAPVQTGVAEDDFDFGPEYAALLQEAVRQRPEVLEGEAQIAAARRGVQYARRSILPSLNLSLSEVYTPNATAFTRPNVGVVALAVNIPVFDGGLARERVREARGVVASAEVTRRQAVDQVRVDVQQAYVALVQARDRVAVANVELAQAREAYRLAQVRYNAGVSQQPGVSPQLELSNAQYTLTLAQTNQITALYDYNTARAQLDRAVGRYALPSTQHPNSP